MRSGRKAFDIAERYRTPVIVLSDAAIGQMCGSVELPEYRQYDADRFDWALKGRDEQHPNGRTMTDRIYYDFAYEDYDPHLRSRYAEMKENEQRWEEVAVSDADIILVAYGISSRICKEAIKLARAEGLHLGLIRPITLWPFPVKSFVKYNGKLEDIWPLLKMNAMGQMVEDVYLAAHGTTPVYSMPTGRDVANSSDIIKYVSDIWRGEGGVLTVTMVKTVPERYTIRTVSAGLRPWDSHTSDRGGLGRAGVCGQCHMCAGLSAVRAW